MSTPPIPRWDACGMYDPPYLDDAGDWVLWADHAPALAEAMARAGKAEAQLAEVTDDFKAAMSEMREDAGLGHHELNDNQRQSIQCMIEAYADQYLPTEPTEGAKT